MGHLKDTLLQEVIERWKSLPGTNTLAYYENSQTTIVKSFLTSTPGYRHDQSRREVAASATSCYPDLTTPGVNVTKLIFFVADDKA